MQIDISKRRPIFERTDGRCHICHKTLYFNNYGKKGSRGAWEIEHSNPRANGGTDRLNNLYAACIGCNRSKGTKSTQSARAKNGKTRAPRSRHKKVEDAIQWGGLGALCGLLVPPPYKLLITIAGAFIGANYGYKTEPD